MPEILQIVVEGGMTDDELLEVLQKIRDIEQRDTNKVFKVFVDAPDMSKERVKAVFAKIDPKLRYMAETT